MIQPDPEISQIFDIVGKTVSNVTFSPSSMHSGEPDQFWITFTDGTELSVVASEWISSIRLRNAE
jgi:hypothetical protein